MENTILHDTALALKAEWGLDINNLVSEETILQMLADRIAKLTAQGPESFYQLMYRLDISEKKLNYVIGDKDVATKIAKLIYDRQLEKIKSRREHKTERTQFNDDPELNW